MNEGYYRTRHKVDVPKSPGQKLTEIIYGVCGVVLLSSLGILVYKTIDHLKTNLKQTETVLVQTENQLESVLAEYNVTKIEHDKLIKDYVKLECNQHAYVSAVKSMLELRKEMKKCINVSDFDDLMQKAKINYSLALSTKSEELSDLFKDAVLNPLEQNRLDRWYSQVKNIVVLEGWDKINKSFGTEDEKLKFWNDKAKSLADCLFIDDAKRGGIRKLSEEQRIVDAQKALMTYYNMTGGSKMMPLVWNQTWPGLGIMGMDMDIYRKNEISALIMKYVNFDSAVSSKDSK